MQTYRNAFAGGGVQWRLDVPGRYFTILSAAQPVDVVFFYQGRKLSLGEIKNWISGPLSGLEVGPLREQQPGIAFDRVEITSTAADTLVIGIGDGTVRYNRAQGSVDLLSAPPGRPYTQAQVNVGVVSTALLAANANRRYLGIQVPSTAANGIFVRCDGGAAVANATCIELLPGQLWEPPVPPTGAINAIGAGAVNVQVIEG